MSTELQTKIDELETIHHSSLIREKVQMICQLAEKENEQALLAQMRYELHL